MSQAELEYWRRLQLLAGRFSPQVAAAILRAYAVIRLSFNERQIADLVATGDIDRVLRQALNASLMDSAFLPVRDRLRSSVGRSIAYFAREIPPPPPAAPAGASVRIGFDVLNPRIVDGIRTLETKVVTGLQDDVRETVRAYVENSLRDGTHSSVIARNLRSVVGLGPSQLQEVQNYRDALNGENGRSIKDYTLRDKRFDRTIAKGDLTPDQVDKMVERYTERRIAQNTETVAHTASMDAMKMGQHLSMADAVERGIYDPDRLVKTWVGVMDARERASHVAMEHETVPWDQPYSNGQNFPGQDEFNCRCLSRYTQRKA